MKHKHYEMIVAKAANMELVVFCKNVVGEWIEQEHSDTDVKFSETGYGYFLCLPQHKEACLHWLNGGRIQYKTELVPEYQDYQPDIEYGLGSIFMHDDFDIHIRPKREKRWIAISMSRGVCCELFESESEAMEAYPLADQFIEIEAEV